MKNLIKTLLILFFFYSSFFSQQNKLLSQIINEVNIDTLKENLSILTGVKPYYNNGEEIIIASRHKDHTGNQLAAEFIYRKLTGYGLETFYQEFSLKGENVYGIQYSQKNPNLYVIICAHYDNMPPGESAPGADDNGSGTVAVIEAARILSKYSFDYSIIYALWDEEEQGLIGSHFYAQQARDGYDSIIAVINLDMIGWDSNNDNAAEIHTRDIANSNQLKNSIINVNQNYDVGLTLSVINPGTNRSDHYSFWLRNYSAVLIIEDMTNDFNEFYHRISDNIDIINFDYYEKMTKLAVGSIAYNAVISENATSVDDLISANFYLQQNYPNPFNPSTTISYSVAQETHIKIIVYNLLGREMSILVDEVKQPGNYSTIYNVETLLMKPLPSGTYFCMLQTGNGYVQTIKMLLLK